MGMTPLKITFTLGSPICLPNRPLHLDALLAYINTQKSLFMLNESSTREDLLALADDLPFKRYEKDGKWVYMASALQPRGSMEKSSRFFTKRNNVGDLCQAMASGQVLNKRDKLPHPKMSHAGQLDFNRGHQRNSLMYHPVANVDAMEAYCVGDKDLVCEAFNQGYLTHLGKLRRLGMGFIKEIDISEDESAKENWKCRVKPFEDEGDVQIISPLNPPYWEGRNNTLCFMPSELI